MIDGLAAVLDSPDLNFTLPDFVGSMPTDLYRPSTSAIPRITDAIYQEEALAASEKLNTIKLENRSLELMEEKSKGAVIASRVALNVSTSLVDFRKAQVNYLVGIDAADVAYEVGMAKNSEIRTNGFKEIDLLKEKGRTLDQRLVGAQIKTNWESEKNTNAQLYVDHEIDLRSVIKDELKVTLDAARNSVTEARKKLEA